MDRESFKIYNKGAYNILTEILRASSKIDNENLILLIADVRAGIKKMIDDDSDLYEMLLKHNDDE